MVSGLGGDAKIAPVKENFDWRVVKWLQPLGNTTTPQARHKLLPSLSFHLWRRGHERRVFLYHKSIVRRWQNCMVPLGVKKQLSICLHSKTLSHPSIAVGVRGSQHCLKHEQRGEWTWTAREEDFLLVDTGPNDQNRLVTFATVGNLEKLCEAETIYIDGTFKASPRLFYQLFTVHAVYSGQHFPFVYALLPNKTTLTYNRFLPISKNPA